MTANSELQPSFAVKAFLDGDDDAKLQTENFRLALDTALASIEAQGFCIAYTLSP